MYHASGSKKEIISRLQQGLPATMDGHLCVFMALVFGRKCELRGKEPKHQCLKTENMHGTTGCRDDKVHLDSSVAKIGVILTEVEDQNQGPGTNPKSHNCFFVKVMEVYLKWWHMAQCGLISKQDEAMCLRIVSKPLSTLKGLQHIKRKKKLTIKIYSLLKL